MAQARRPGNGYPEPMRLLRLLLALLAAAPASAGNVRVAPVVVPRVGGTPLPLPAGTGASLTGTSLASPNYPVLRASLEPSLAIAALNAPTPAFFVGAAPAAAADAPVASQALLPAGLAPAAPADAPELPVDPRSPKTSARELLRNFGKPTADQAAARLAQAFDGAGRATASDGSVFEVQAAPDARGAVRFVRVAPAPAAAPRAVPGTEGLAGKALLDALGRISRSGQRQHEYEEASNYLFSKADNVEIGGVRGVVDAYSGVFVPGTSTEGSAYPEPGDRNHDGHVDEGMNVEHVWPQSLFDKKLPMRSDLHHLMATFIHPNGVRAALPFGVVDSALKGRSPYPYKNDAGTKSDGVVFEPADFSKGRVARNMLYFYSRYRDSSIFSGQGGVAWWNKQVDILLDWNRRFPPDAGEKARNDRVAAFQGNRNPFVDDHTLADRVGRETWRPAPPPRAKRAESKGFRRSRPSPHRRR